MHDAAAEDLRVRIEQLESVLAGEQKDGRSWESATQSTIEAPTLSR
jgi:hypothetical protein